MSLSATIVLFCTVLVIICFIMMGKDLLPQRTGWIIIEKKRASRYDGWKYAIKHEWLHPLFGSWYSYERMYDRERRFVISFRSPKEAKRYIERNYNPSEKRIVERIKVQ